MTRTDHGLLLLLGARPGGLGALSLLGDLARNVGSGPLLLLSGATRESRKIADECEFALRDHGLSDVVRLGFAGRAEANAAGVVGRVREAGAFLFADGNPLRLTTLLGGTSLLARIRERFAGGATLAGASAGGAAVASTMLLPDPERASRSADPGTASGLGLLGGVVLDTCSDQRGRLGRLLAAVANNPEVVGIGVAQDAALSVTGEHLEVLGAGAVTIVDGRESGWSNPAERRGRAPGIHDVRVHVLTAGDRLDRETLRPVHP